jgi:hypothetical protein
MAKDGGQDDDVVDTNPNTLAEVKELCTEALRTPRDIQFWSKTIHTTWLYMKNSREWVEYEQQSKVMHEDVNRRREQYIKEQVASYKGAMVIDREVVKWDFNGVIPSYSVVEKIDKSAVLYGNFIFDIFLLILISKLN